MGAGALHVVADGPALYLCTDRARMLSGLVPGFPWEILLKSILAAVNDKWSSSHGNSLLLFVSSSQVIPFKYFCRLHIVDLTVMATYFILGAKQMAIFWL